MKRLKITESQLNRLLLEEDVQKISINNMIKELKSSFNCGANNSGGNFKTLVTDMMYDYGFEDVVIQFLDRDEHKNMIYVIYTEKIMLTITVDSGVDAKDKPCLTISDVDIYKLVQ